MKANNNQFQQPISAHNFHQYNCKFLIFCQTQSEILHHYHICKNVSIVCNSVHEKPEYDISFNGFYETE
jgi:hypothetical protein